MLITQTPFDLKIPENICIKRIGPLPKKKPKPHQYLIRIECAAAALRQLRARVGHAHVDGKRVEGVCARRQPRRLPDQRCELRSKKIQTTWEKKAESSSEGG